MRVATQGIKSGTTNCGQQLAAAVLFMSLLLSSSFIVHADTNITVPATNDVRVLIDISGSMKKNDPTNLRQPALNLFVSLLPTETHSGVWTFGQWVNMLIPHGPVNAQWKKHAKESVQKINSVGLYTNIEDAIRRSTWDWRNTKASPDFDRSLILLTDGLVDISKDADKNIISRKNILQDLLPALQKSGVTIHAIALSNESDRNLLEQLTTATGGRFETIKTTKNLERLFLHLFENVAPTDSLPITENRVKVDGSIKEMTFLIFREDTEKEGSITSPTGKTYTINNQQTNMTWHKESHYDLVTVKDPNPGYWKINTKVDPDNRVMIVTDLKLVTSKLPDTLLAGSKQEFFAHLEDSGKKIDRQDFLHFVKVKLTQESWDENNKEKTWKLKLSDNGRGIDKDAKDGIYSIQLKKSLIPGEHELEVAVNGTTFKRHYRKQIIIHDKPASANIELIENKILRVSILPYQTLIDASTVEVSASHKMPDGNTEKVAINKLSVAEWMHEFPTQGAVGKHEISIKITGKNKDGVKIKSRLTPLTMTIDEPVAPAVETHDTEDSNEPETNTEEQEFSWAMVSLKVGIFNLFIFALAFALYKYSGRIKEKVIPNIFEEKVHA